MLMLFYCCYCYFCVGVDDLRDVFEQLHSLNKTEIHNLGLMLGISHKRLLRMEQSNFLNEMIYSWLTQVDNVPSEGRPSWETLAEALNHPTIGQTGLAQRILSKVQDFNKHIKVSIAYLDAK